MEPAIRHFELAHLGFGTSHAHPQLVPERQRLGRLRGVITVAAHVDTMTRMANGRGCRPKVCKDCGALSDDGYQISFRGLCEGCGIRRHTNAAKEMHAGAGPAHDKWRARMLSVLDLDADARSTGEAGALDRS
jgi:hypothetical protein